MRFDLPESIDAMLAGRKTQTRRRSPYWLKKRPGSTITIQHQGRQIGQATVLRTWSERVADADWKAEGYPSWRRFWHAWWTLYPTAKDSDAVTVVEFGPVRWNYVRPAGERQEAVVEMDEDSDVRELLERHPLP